MAVGPAVAATSFKASASAAAATAAPYFTAASSGLQAIGAINNARFQADLNRKQNEQLRADAAFKASETEISIETEKLKLAREEVLKLRKFNQIDGDNVAGSFARGVAIEQDAAQIAGLRNLVEELNIYSTEKVRLDLNLDKSLKNLSTSVNRQININDLEAANNTAAQYVSAVGILGKGYVNTVELLPGKFE